MGGAVEVYGGIHSQLVRALRLVSQGPLMGADAHAASSQPSEHAEPDLHPQLDLILRTMSVQLQRDNARILAKREHRWANDRLSESLVQRGIDLNNYEQEQDMFDAWRLARRGQVETMMEVRSRRNRNEAVRLMRGARQA